MSKKYRKLPVIIEAVRFIGGNFAEIKFFAHVDASVDDNDLLIRTTNGWVKANHGEWIIKGVNGEFYPCPHDVFVKTYEIV